MPTIQDLLNKDADLASLDRQVLLAHAIGQDKTYLVSHNDTELTTEQLQQYAGLLERRRQGEPVAYIVDYKEFYGRNFKVTPATLIPRPETELLIEKALVKKPSTILDVGTGSGCIAITLGCELPNAEITALDISPNALEVAKRNAQELCPEAKLSFLQSDLLAQIKSGAHFDLIAANLPYVTASAPMPNPFEPETALYSGADGLDHYRQLFQQLVDQEISFDDLLCEIGYDQGESIQQLSENLLGKQGTVYSDLAGLPRLFHLTNN